MSTDLIPTTEHLDTVRTFLYALHDEMNTTPNDLSARTAGWILFGNLGTSSIGYISQSLKTSDEWTEGDARRWWLLTEILKGYKDRPDFPETLRPFIDTPER